MVVSVGLCLVSVGCLTALELVAESDCVVAIAAAVEISSGFTVALFSSDLDVAAAMRFDDPNCSLSGRDI